MITSAALTMRFGDTVALNHLTLAVQPGEIYCLLGPHGSGKSTAIDLFMGFLTPGFGTASIEGYDVAKFPHEVRKRTALVTAQTPLYDRLTPIQHMELFASMYARRDQQKSSIVARLRAAGLPERAMSERVASLSAGFRQKIAVAIALLKNTPAVLLDEPAGGLDPRSAADVLNLLKEMREQGKEMLMTTDDVVHARKIADRVGLLKDGLLIRELRREEFIREDLERSYLHLFVSP